MKWISRIRTASPLRLTNLKPSPLWVWFSAKVTSYTFPSPASPIKKLHRNPKVLLFPQFGLNEIHREPLAFLHSVERSQWVIIVWGTVCLFNSNIFRKATIARLQRYVFHTGYITLSFQCLPNLLQLESIVCCTVHSMLVVVDNHRQKSTGLRVRRLGFQFQLCYQYGCAMLSKSLPHLRTSSFVKWGRSLRVLSYPPFCESKHKSLDGI